MSESREAGKSGAYQGFFEFKKIFIKISWALKVAKWTMRDLAGYMYYQIADDS